jgi:glucose-6-phosphate 1-dehydrogenase
MSGDVALYRRLDHIQTCGELVEPILDVRSVLPARDFPDYTAGFRVSQAADRLLVREGRGWHPGRICRRTGYG